MGRTLGGIEFVERCNSSRTPSPIGKVVTIISIESVSARGDCVNKCLSPSVGNRDCGTKIRVEICTPTARGKDNLSRIMDRVLLKLGATSTRGAVARDRTTSVRFSPSVGTVCEAIDFGVRFYLYRRIWVSNFRFRGYKGTILGYRKGVLNNIRGTAYAEGGSFARVGRFFGSGPIREVISGR